MKRKTKNQGDYQISVSTTPMKEYSNYKVGHVKKCIEPQKKTLGIQSFP